MSDVIDHHNLRDNTGYQYDVEIPFKLQKNNKTLAWIEPYFGDLHLTGQPRENDNGSPGLNDLAGTALAEAVGP